MPQVNKPEISTEQQHWSSSESPVPRKSARGARSPVRIPIYCFTDTSSTSLVQHFAIHSRKAEIFKLKCGRLEEVVIQVLFFPVECFAFPFVLFSLVKYVCFFLVEYDNHTHYSRVHDCLSAGRTEGM